MGWLSLQLGSMTMPRCFSGVVRYSTGPTLAPSPAKGQGADELQDRETAHALAEERRDLGGFHVDRTEVHGARRLGELGCIALVLAVVGRDLDGAEIHGALLLGFTG